ncbi:MAG TPA: tRNA (adenosine(37)-N6)-threonylcarbamoyltransferase complex transferase subunit TsaD [Candidatus Paceibacterota bacterium]|nr:tRNA (adenosine(37)-N6)-threonylcarbamoyltransferase complex transferase subunit TsaD [Candidatus Paceibacterota bacterium]
MRILGIETSCDETAVCLIEASGAFGTDFRYEIIGNALHSQIATHAPWGGVFPNLAKREHAKHLVPLLEQVLPQPQTPRGLTSGGTAGLEELLAREPELLEMLQEFLKTHDRPDIDAIAVTHGPGLAPALWVGVNFARALSTLWQIPLIAVNHLEGHIIMAAMDVGHRMSHMREVAFPALALLISGGHTEIDLIESWPRFTLIGQTRDDAVGEAFDKVARMLGIPYPGGAELSRMASVARARNETPEFKLPRPMMHDDGFDFSFSGLKTAVLRLVDKRELSAQEKEAVALEFENAASDVLVAKTKRAAEEHNAQTLLVGGGVSANEFIKTRLAEALDIPVFAPPPELATDNALMIALAGYFHALQGEFVDPNQLRADGNLKLGS